MCPCRADTQAWAQLLWGGHLPRCAEAWGHLLSPSASSELRLRADLVPSPRGGEQSHTQAPGGGPDSQGVGLGTRPLRPQERGWVDGFEGLLACTKTRKYRNGHPRRTNTHYKDRQLPLTGGNFQCLHLKPFKRVRPCASGPGRGRHHHPYLRLGKLRPREGKQLSQAVLGLALGLGHPQVPHAFFEW